MLQTAASGGKKITFGLIFFSSNEASSDQNKYHLVMDSARFADQHGFSSIWIPERHFTRDGWLYPNPAVLQAAIARETTSIGLRAGSVVMPLHNPLRVAEEWAMVDNLSNGRVGISFASGWHPNDFALFPENYGRRNEEMYRGIEMVRKLWRGEKVEVKSGDGSMVALQTYPTPIQKELPFWVTAAGNPKTFEGAGAIGANLLTHMYNQNVDELAAKIRIYRDSLAQHGFDPAAGQVSVMLHTFIAKDEETVRAQAQGPFIEYLKSASYLVNAIAYSRGQQVDLNTLSEQDLHDYLLFVFDRLVSTQRVLFGTPESCLPLVKQLQEAGVNEIACQMDFGVPTQQVLESLPYLNGLKNAVPLAVSGYSELSSAQGQQTTNASNGHQNSNGARPHHVDAGQASLAHEQGTTKQQSEQQLAHIQRRCRAEVALDHFYQVLDRHGIELGASFRGIQHLWRNTLNTHEALGEIALSPTFAQDAAGYQIHPTLLDACNQVLIAALPEALFTDSGNLYLPTGMRSFRQYGNPGQHVWSHAQFSSAIDAQAPMIAGDVHIYDDEGELLVEMLGLQLQRTALMEQAAATVVEQTDVQQWLYELQWQALTIPQAQTDLQTGRWLLFEDKHGVSTMLKALLSERGQECISVQAGEQFAEYAPGHYVIRPDSAEDMRKLLQAQSAGSTPLRGAIHVWSLDSTPVQQTNTRSLQHDQRISSQNALYLLQQSIEKATPGEFKLWLVTQGAQAVSGQESSLSLSQSPLWGLGKTCAMEHPELWGGLVDLDSQDTADNAAFQLLDSLLGEHTEDLIAFRAGQSYGARMVRSEPFASKTLAIAADASYVISGGLWGLGLEVARWLAQKGAGHLVLLGRTQLPAREEWDNVPDGTRLEQQIQGIRTLEGLGAQVHYASVDVANETQLNTFLQEYTQSHAPIRGVVHAASVWQDANGQSLVGTLANLSVQGLEAVFQPKVIGSWLLQQALKEQPLDFFVSFSSGASLFGSAGQGNYAAAGEFLDVLASQQRHEGVHALSIDWGAISQVGFGGTAEGMRVHEYWEAHGIQRINPQQVLEALELLIPQDHARVGVLKLDWQQLQQFYPQIGKLPLVSHLIDLASTAEVGQQQEHAIRQSINDAEPAQREQVLEGYLAQQVAAVLRITDTEIDVQQPLTSLGLDSLMAIELKNRLETELTVHIPIVTFLQGPSIVQFTAQLLPQLVDTETATESAPSMAAHTLISSRADGQNQVAAHTTQATQAAQETQHVQHNLAQLDPPISQQENTTLETRSTSTAQANDLDAQQAEALLAQLDNLSDEEVDALLKQMAQQEEDH